MAKHSKEILDDVEAKNAILAIQDAAELQAFGKGEQRDDLLDLVVFRLNVLKAETQHKQGEQQGPITQQTHDFKGSGVEGKKHITGEDIVKEIDEADAKKAADLERRDAEALAAAEKAKLEAAGPRSYVTAEDVIKKMRAEGKKI